MDVAPQDSLDDFPRALGQEIVKLWGHLPQDIQCRLFEQTISSQLAVFLHDRHPRTNATLKAPAIPEPDSLGG